MIKAIIFDCYGVLASDGWLPFKQNHFGMNPKLLEQASEVNHQADRGEISHSQFIERIAALAHDEARSVSAEIEHNPVNMVLFEYIATELKLKFKIGLLSNASRNRLAEIFKPTQVELFDAVGLSCDIGAIKPDALMYTTIADRLHVQPQECIFIDDQQGFCDGAAAVGMAVVKFDNNQQAMAEIERILTQKV